MSFADVSREKFVQAKKLEWLDLTSITKIRILENKALKFYTHFINNSTFKCLGEDCPICRNNQDIIMKHPSDFRDQKGYYPKTAKFVVNVLDKTLVKICPKCGAEIKQTKSPTCPKCNTMIVDVVATPLNKVKILAKGVQLFDDLNIYDASILDNQGTPAGLTKFDLTLISSGTGKQTKYTIIPDISPTGDYKEEVVDSELFFDKESAVITLTPDEIADVLNGVSIRDIFLGRRANTETVEVKEVVSEKVSVDVQKQIDELFGN